MAKQMRALPARRQRDRLRVEESVLLRSAATLGRVIGTLQRQIDGATHRFTAGDAVDDAGPDVKPAVKSEPRKAKRSARTATKTRSAKTATKPKSASRARSSARKTTAKAKTTRRR